MAPVRQGLLCLVTPQEVHELRLALVKRGLPPDFEAKLSRLGEGNLIQRYVEQNSRLFFALLLAASESSFIRATPSDRERLLRVLAYVRKDDDAIPDYLPSGFMDDQQEVRAAADGTRSPAPGLQGLASVSPGARDVALRCPYLRQSRPRAPETASTEHGH